MKNLRISDAGLQHIIRHEGMVLKPYTDPAGFLTIGVGHLITEEEQMTGRIIIGDEPVYYAYGLTREQAIQLLRQDIRIAEVVLSQVISVPLTQGMVDILVSFIFNVGPGNFRRSTLLKKLNLGFYFEVADELLKWTKAGGRTLPGLVRRRREEASWWLREARKLVELGDGNAWVVEKGDGREGRQAQPQPHLSDVGDVSADAGAHRADGDRAVSGTRDREAGAGDAGGPRHSLWRQVLGWLAKFLGG